MASGKKSKPSAKRPAKKKSKSPGSKGPVKKTMLIGEVVSRYPEAVGIMLERGFHCIGCHVSPFETIEQGAQVHGIAEKEVDRMVSEINSAISGSKRGKKG